MLLEDAKLIHLLDRRVLVTIGMVYNSVRSTILPRQTSFRWRAIGYWVKIGPWPKVARHRFVSQDWQSSIKLNIYYGVDKE